MNDSTITPSLSAEPIRGELFGASRLAAHVRMLASTQRVAEPVARRRWPGRRPELLSGRLELVEREIRDAEEALSAATEAGQDLSPAGAWLLDNIFVVIEQIQEIRAALPAGYYDELPKLAAGSRAGYPRVYEIAVEMIAHTDGRLESESLELVLAEFQQVTPLTMGELWAVPAMLRLGYLENVRRVTARTRIDVEEAAKADRWVARLGDAAARGDGSLAAVLSEFVHVTTGLTPEFITRFIQQMRVRRTDFTPLLWLEQWIAEDAMSVEEAVQRTTQDLALAQLVIANSITSLRLVPDLDWASIFERQSASEAVLRDDPAGVYAAMTFATRDRYRHVVERLAKGSRHAEPAVAAAAVALAKGQTQGTSQGRTAHVGYFLVGDGFAELATTLGYAPKWRDRVQLLLLEHPTPAYFTTLAAFTIAGLLIAMGTLVDGETSGRFAVMALSVLALIPASEVAVAIVNQLAAVVVVPARLPRLDFSRGIPADCRTVVTVPVIWPSVESVVESISHLETQFLANRDDAIRFVLLSDLSDAATETRPDDDRIVAAAIEGIRGLNAVYSASGGDGLADGPFYLLHRPRRWNATEGLWMGWERKRGKLAELNDHLRGVNRGAFSVTVGDLPWLRDVRFVITLDADTVLPRDGAAALIGTMAHPLNRAEFDETTGLVTRGYGILQPRVSISLRSANASRFASIYAGHVGVDPYTTAVSDVYQDLFGAGTFTGKGIYDVDVFRRATHGRFPENAVLSHDLIEGTFARAGLVTDVEVFDDYPRTYITTLRRAHRWVRGDWQLLPWLRSHVPGRDGLTVNPLPALSRWKITDNLRRSLAPIASLAWILAAWTVPGMSPVGSTVAALVALVVPWLISPLVAALRPPRGLAWRPYYSAVGQDATAAATQAVLGVLLLPLQAGMAADAIVRTWARLWWSHRKLLQWETAAQVERTVIDPRSIPRLLVPGICLAILMAVVALLHFAAPGEMRTWLPLSLLALGWVWAPQLIRALGEPSVRVDLTLNAEDRAVAEEYASRHWAFFDQFASEATHWLVPDNFQEIPSPIAAGRTSPTNLGLQLISTMAAYDLGFLAMDAMLDRLERALDSMNQLRRLRGHFYNWYDLSDLRVLDPPYVSTVDSGNLAGHLIALAQGCVALSEERKREADEPQQVARLTALATRARTMAMAMDFSMLYDERRKLFAIGYDDATGRMDVSSYDLLASEARLASFVAIAKGDVPAEHWFRLGRSLTRAEGMTALVSWSGSMFEYLMPALVMPARPNSLLAQTSRAAVVRQMAYGDAARVPWGISESAYNRRDQHDTYQYRAFGVPDLALKRGLSEDLVIAPYASVLAMSIDPRRALANLRRLESLGALGAYGFVDSLDYTRPDPGAPFAAVRTFMAHHVGMSMIALCNALRLDGGLGIWQRRFMADPSIRAAALLLDERVPRLYVPRPPQALPMRRMPVSSFPPVAVRKLTTAHTPEPRVGLLGGPSYRVLLSNAGGGQSSSREIAVTRWRADATRDDTGYWIYVRNLTAGKVWSVAHQPTGMEADDYTVSLAPDQISFRRRDGDIETSTDVVVVPRERAEVRRVEVCNRSRAVVEVELTSYAEVVLGAADADRAHPAFQNLFVQTERVEEQQAILATRRRRSPDELLSWCAHTVATGSERVGVIGYETDRARFVGRGRSPRAPRALDRDQELSGTVGAVLDPILSLRVRLRIEPGRAATVAFATVVADSRESVLRVADRYRQLGGAERALTLAATETRVELRELDISPTEAVLYQELAGALIYPNDALGQINRDRRMAQSTPPLGERRVGLGQQRCLWAHGISGDHPIVLATISNPAGLPSIRQLLVAHKYWRMKGVISDLVILNTNAPSYLQTLHDQLIAMGLASSEGGLIDKPGGVFIRRPDAIPPDDIAMLHALARIHIDCDGIGLGEIVAAARRGNSRAVPASQRRQLQARASARAADTDPFPNGHGRVTPEGDYLIRVAGSHVPPSPWSNVVANPNAGFLVTERGGGYTWVGNAYLYRLTPWQNDPVTDPCGDVFYLQDAETGAMWTPTPAPSPAEGDPDQAPLYTVRHRQGASVFEHERLGITSELTMAVPASDPVKIMRLRLTNRGTAPRRLIVTRYVEWVLGTQREATRYHVCSRFDEASGALFATNQFFDDFTDEVAFSWVSEPITGFTADRDEFIGRNGHLSAPAGLTLGALSERVGVGLDPCAVLRCVITLAPGETRELIALLGAAYGADEARAVIGRNRTGTPIDAAVDTWRERLATITVRTPSPELDAMVNKWWLYQTLSCRMWGRSALYQSSGAYGFRDQLQDCMAFVYAEPAVARAHLLRAAGRQFHEGDVQHWWHEPSGRGVRTRFSDDLVWLPHVADHHISITGDTSLWDEQVEFLDMRPLDPAEHERYDTPGHKGERATLFEHCVRALDHACTTGVHGLPLFGSGDWNDGMNRVGILGRGESVWLAWFLIATLRRFADHAEARGAADVATRMRARADGYATAAEQSAWDGQWFRRGYYDDGAPLGSSSSDECQIDSVAQSWAVLSGGADPSRARRAMQSVDQRLVRRDARLIALLDPPFDRSDRDPGYIRGYVPGVRENGAQYTHAAVWVAMAAARLGDGDRALEYLQMLNPLLHARTAGEVAVYMVEPYVACADVYAAPAHLGRGGWTWYTGSASLSYRAAVESILGFRKRGCQLTIAPCIPAQWKSFEIDFRHEKTPYAIRVENPHGVSCGVGCVTVDGTSCTSRTIDLMDDGRPHQVVITMGESASP